MDNCSQEETSTYISTSTASPSTTDPYKNTSSLRQIATNADEDHSRCRPDNCSLCRCYTTTTNAKSQITINKNLK
jgi:hypothetical protein